MQPGLCWRQADGVGWLEAVYGWVLLGWFGEQRGVGDEWAAWVGVQEARKPQSWRLGWVWMGRVRFNRREGGLGTRQ